MKNRGLVLVEVMIAAALMLLLSGLLFAGWAKGVRSWTLVSQRNDLLTQAQRFVRLLEREVASSTAGSVEIRDSNPTCLSYASSFDLVSRQTFEADEKTGVLHWQKQIVVYQPNGSDVVFRRELPLAVNSAAYLKAKPISLINFGSGLHGVEHYATDGDPIARRVDDLAFELQGLNLLTRLTVTNGKDRSIEVSSVTRLRN